MIDPDADVQIDVCRKGSTPSSYRIMIYPTTAKITNTAAVTIMVVLDILSFSLVASDTTHRPESLHPCLSRPCDPQDVTDGTSVEQILEVYGVVLPFPHHINQSDVAPGGITLH